MEEIFFRRRRAFLCLYGCVGQSLGLGFRPRFRGAGASGGMIRLGETFLRTKPIVEELNIIHWKGRREKFQAEHGAELRAFQAARRVLKERYGITGAKGIAIQEWKKEKAQLTRERESLYGQYKLPDKEMSRLLAVRHRAEIVSRQNEKEKCKDERETML